MGAVGTGVSAANRLLLEDPNVEVIEDEGGDTYEDLSNQAVNDED